jgi:NAD(P)H-hydrate epimerase
MVGAGCLAAEGTLRSGAGLVWLASPAGVVPVTAAKLTCVMTRALPQTAEGTVSRGALPDVLQSPCDVLLVGPGLGRHPETDLFVRDLVRAAPVPLVLDADALNAIAGRVETAAGRTAPTILTPHPGEMARLMDRTVAEIEANRTGAAEELARRIGAVVILKGAGTVVSDGGRTRVNETGNPGMATAGSGDVLSGVVAGLLGTGFDSMDAAALGVHIHGLAGDLAAEGLGEISLTASDILDHLPLAFEAYRSGA